MSVSPRSSCCYYMSRFGLSSFHYFWPVYGSRLNETREIRPPYLCVSAVGDGDCATVTRRWLIKTRKGGRAFFDLTRIFFGAANTIFVVLLLDGVAVRFCIKYNGDG